MRNLPPLKDKIRVEIKTILAERGSVEDLAKIFPDNSVDEIIANGPQAEFLEEAARITKPGGKIYINANFSNRYRFGTRKGKKPPSEEVLDELGIRLVSVDGKLNPKFENIDY